MVERGGRRLPPPGLHLLQAPKTHIPPQPPRRNWTSHNSRHPQSTPRPKSNAPQSNPTQHVREFFAAGSHLSERQGDTTHKHCLPLHPARALESPRERQSPPPTPSLSRRRALRRLSGCVLRPLLANLGRGAPRPRSARRGTTSGGCRRDEVGFCPIRGKTDLNSLRLR